MVGIILAFIFLTPRDWFRDSADSARRQHRTAGGKRRQCAVRGFRGACRRARATASRPPAGVPQTQPATAKVNVTRVEPILDSEGELQAIWLSCVPDANSHVFPQTNSVAHAALALWVAGSLRGRGRRVARDQLQATFDRMDRAAASFKGLSAEVTKISHNALLNEDDSFTGSIAVRRGPKQRDLALWWTSCIRPQEGSADRPQGGMYYPKTNTKQIIDLDKKGSKDGGPVSVAGLRQRFGRDSKRLHGGTRRAGNRGRQKTVRLVLTPSPPTYWPN